MTGNSNDEVFPAAVTILSSAALARTPSMVVLAMTRCLAARAMTSFTATKATIC